MTEKQIPVILHTDIGGDIDDTWALAMMLRQNHLKPLYVLTDTGDAKYRAAICAKMLERAGRTEIEVGIGHTTDLDKHPRRQEEWVKDYDIFSYKGKVHEDGVKRLIDIIMASDQIVTLVSIGPCPALADALKREPAIAAKTRFVGMFGSIYKSHGNSPKPIAEYNVATDIKACQAVFRAPWVSATITPLDTCGRITLDGELYARVWNSGIPLVKDMVANYVAWAKKGGWIKDFDKKSSILFDTVAIHLASSTQFLKMEKMPVTVRDDGFTVIDKENGAPFNVAIDWLNLDAYAAFLVNVLTQEKD